MSGLCRRTRQEAVHCDDPKHVDVPKDLLCPITSGLFVSLMVLHRAVFEESAVLRWVEETSCHPRLQGIWRATPEREYASDIACLCSRFGAARGSQLCPDTEMLITAQSGLHKIEDILTTLLRRIAWGQ